MLITYYFMFIIEEILKKNTKKKKKKLFKWHTSHCCSGGLPQDRLLWFGAVGGEAQLQVLRGEAVTVCDLFPAPIF